MTHQSNKMRLSVRLHYGGGAMFGPGKADLLALIAETGSIAAAGRRLNMSYKRAWGLVDKLNAMFADPLVESNRGGARHGGAKLTPMGENVLSLYRAMESNARATSQAEIAGFMELLADPPGAPEDRSE